MNLASSVLGDYFGLLADSQIRELAQAGMITPFSERVSGGLSFGLSPHGYDVRASGAVRVHSAHSVFDVKNAMGHEFSLAPVHQNERGIYVTLPPRSFALLNSVETFDLPADITCEVWGKSTYARGGVHILVTPLEAGWLGTITIEVANMLNVPNTLYVGEGIAQVRFHKCDPATSPYAGKYQGQVGVTLPRVTE